MESKIVRTTVIKDHPVRIYELDNGNYYAEVDNDEGKIECVTDAYANQESAYNEAMDFMRWNYPELFNDNE